MANSVTARFNDDCKVFVSMSNDTTVNKAVIIDAEGNETDIGGGGGVSSDWNKAIVRVKNNSSAAALEVMLATLENDNFITAFLFDATNGVNATAESIGYAANTDTTDTYYIYEDAYIALYSLTVADAEAFQVEGSAEIIETSPEAPPLVKVTGDCTITLNDIDNEQ